jgi:hypothetical protein
MNQRNPWPPSGPFIFGPENILIAAAFTDGNGPSTPTYDKLDCVPFTKIFCEILSEDPIATSSEWPDRKGKTARIRRRPKRQKTRTPTNSNLNWDYARKAMETQAIRDAQKAADAQAIHDRYLRIWKQTCQRHGGIHKTVFIIMETAEDRPLHWLLCGRYLIQSLRYSSATACSVTDVEDARITSHPVWCSARDLARELIETKDQCAILKKWNAVPNCTFCLSDKNEKALAKALLQAAITQPAD